MIMTSIGIAPGPGDIKLDARVLASLRSWDGDDGSMRTVDLYIEG